jgi:multidrug resistance efflux pump
VVSYKVRPEMHTRRYDEYVEGHEDDDIYQEEIEVDYNFMVSNGAGLVELDTGDVELLDEEAGPSRKHIQKSKQLLEIQEKREQHDARVAEIDSDAETFDM